MHTRAALILLLLPPILLAAEPHRDRNGDPLPEGAVARFGSGRLLHGGVEHLEFSPDGKQLATSGRDGARLWDAATGKEVALAYLPRTGSVVLTFTPDGHYLVGDRKGCRVFDPATGKVRCFWRNGKKVPAAIVGAADGKSAATAWEEGGITVHDLKGAGRRPGRALSDDRSSKLALSGDGALLAYSTEKAIRLWDVPHARLLQSYTFVPGPGRRGVISLCLSRDGRQLAASLEDRVHLWDTRSHKEVKGFMGTTDEIRCLHFSDDGTQLVGADGYSRTVLRWSAATGKELARSPSPQGAGRYVWWGALARDGRTIAGIGTEDHGIRLWDATWKELAPVERWPKWREIAFLQPGVAVTWTASEDPEVLAFWDVADGRLRHKRSFAVPHYGWYRRLLSPDGKLLAAANEKKGILLFDVERGEEVLHLDVPRRGDIGAKFAFSPDGKTIVTTDDPRGLRTWEAATGRPLRRLEGDSSGVMEFSPDGRTVASAFVGRFYLTEVASGKARLRLPLPESEERQRAYSAVDRIRFARNGRSVAAFSTCDLHVFSTDRGKTLLHLYLGERTSSWSETGDLSPDGRWLAHANNFDGEVYVHDLHNPRAASDYQTLAGHAGGIEAVAFSPDGKYLVSCGEDGTALVWDASRLTGKPPPPEPETDEPELKPGPPPRESASRLWDALADTDAARAGRAMADLTDSPDSTVALLKARLAPAEAPAAERVERLIADLDSDTLAVRRKAFAELQKLAELAAPALRKALATQPSAEAARQIRELLRQADDRLTDPERLRPLRAVEVLERIGTPQARKVLEVLAKGAPAAQLTREAKAALERSSTP